MGAISVAKYPLLHSPLWILLPTTPWVLGSSLPLDRPQWDTDWLRILPVFIGGTLVRRARAGHAPGIFFDPCPTGDLLGGALSAVRAQCNYLDG